jgi:hypothetical protein
MQPEEGQEGAQVCCRWKEDAVTTLGRGCLGPVMKASWSGMWCMPRLQTHVLVVLPLLIKARSRWNPLLPLPYQLLPPMRLVRRGCGVKYMRRMLQKYTG